MTYLTLLFLCLVFLASFPVDYTGHRKKYRLRR